ncbi:MAG: extracellular solute-binding protein [Clostridia bacterium]|nr:extracellular solute-binding protein [Clostridia bacterium]
MKRILSIVICLILAWGTACAALAADEVSIVFCVNIQPQLPRPFWQSIADRYMAAHPDVRVEIIGNPSLNVTLPQYEKTLLVTDQFPDVMVMQNPADFVPSGALLAFDEGDLDYLVDPEVGMIDGKQYVANYKKQIIGVFYNVDMFAANGIGVPKTWQALMEACDKLLAAGIQPFSIGLKDGWPQSQLANMLAGTELLAKDVHWGARRNADAVKFNNPDLVRAMEKYQTICTRYSGPNIAGITYTQMLEQFFTGKAAMLPIGSWVNAEVAKDGQDFEVGWFPIPGESNADVVSVYVNEGLAIGANTRYPEICKDFIRYFFTDKALYGEFLKSEQLFSTTKEAVEYEMIPLRKDMEAQIADMVEVEGFESMTGDDAFLPGLKDYFTNQLTQSIAMGADVPTELDAFDEEWAIARAAVEDAG